MQALWDKLEREGVELSVSEAGDAARLVDNRELSALAGDSLAGRFRHWRGSSGRRYIFSVYDPDSCPAYDGVVLIGAAIDENNARRIIFVADTGILPDVALARAREKAAACDCAVEFHVHLLASSRRERAAAIADLSTSDHARRN
ncbi:MAG TPA: hypothetical protein VGY52_17380 [Roseiarcus sp.]|nr:hypothetical protein [Roseiarcus sp.]